MRYFIFCLILLFSFDVSADDFASSVEWLSLGHYHDNKSSIDSPNFFLSEEGKTNSVAELHATIDLFNGKDMARKCLFPARWLLLKKQGLIKTDFPVCDEYEQFKQDLQPAGITLLFTDAYMNNPSSMFGHTLLRIDTKRKGTQLLAHGANYGAFTGDDPGVLYALWGLTGGYFGGFTVKPYYDIINTYNNIENRDIWELNLDFSQEELDFFVAHLWEIGQTQSRYYFFSRNCSYMLMEMIDAVRPSLQLADKFPIQAIPLDTFKEVYRSKDLIKGVNYRPSRQNKIRHRYKQMNELQRETYLDIIKTGKYSFPDSMSEAEKADVLETAYQYVQYKYTSKDIDLEDYRKRSFDALRGRSMLTEKGYITELTNAASPLMAHESMRIVVSGGVRDGEAFQSISYRPAYQSLTDNEFGLAKGAEINFLETEMRHYDKKNKYVLHNVDLLSIRSLSPIDEMFNSFSFQVKANVERWQNPISEDDGYVGNLKIGSGGTYSFTDWLWGFTMFDVKISYGGFLPHNSWMAIGSNVGLLAKVGNFRVLAEVEPQLASQKLGQMVTYKLETNYVVGTNWAIEAKVLCENKYGNDVEEFLTGVRFYF